MSFILDALKKSETDRQQRSSAEFAKVPASSGPNRMPGWLLLLGLLLAINLLVLLGLFFRPSTEPAAVPLGAATEAIAPPVRDTGTAPAREDEDPQNEPSFANRIAEAKRNRPAASEDSPVVQPDLAETRPPPAAVGKPPGQAAAALPTFYEVIADGRLVLPDLHLDIHVYSEVPRDRFVFINMSKQREKSQLSEGPVVEEITADGVILTYRGTSFLLPRD